MGQILHGSATTPKVDLSLNGVCAETISLAYQQIRKVNDKASDDARAVTNATIRNTYILIFGRLGIVTLLVAALVVVSITNPLSVSSRR
jgi:hypothetical protein